MRDRSTSELDIGIEALRAGQSAEARAQFTQVLQAQPQNELVWLWLSSLMPTSDQSLRCLSHGLALHTHGRNRIGEWLIQQGLLAQPQLESALLHQAVLRRQGQSLLLGQILVQCGYIEQDALQEALQRWQQSEVG